MTGKDHLLSALRNQRSHPPAWAPFVGHKRHWAAEARPAAPARFAAIFPQPEPTDAKGDRP